MISFIACEAFQRDRPFTVYARFDDVSAVFEPKLIYKVSGDPRWRHAPFKPRADGVFKATIAKAELSGALAYFVEAFDENGNGPARVGSPEQPLFARKANSAPACREPGKPVIVAAPVEAIGAIDPAPNTIMTIAPQSAGCGEAVYCKPWFWIAAGGAALLAVGITAAIAGRDDDRGYPDRVDLVVQPLALAGP